MGGMVAGGMHGRRGMHGGGACVVGHARQGGMHGRGVCVAGGVHGRGACMARGACVAGGMHGRGGHVWQILRDTVNERAVRILLELMSQMTSQLGSQSLCHCLTAI